MLTHLNENRRRLKMMVFLGSGLFSFSLCVTWNVESSTESEVGKTWKGNLKRVSRFKTASVGNGPVS